MPRSRVGWIVVTSIALAACTDGTPAEPAGGIGLQAELYLNAALDIMEANSVRRLEIDWVAFREQARADAQGAITTQDVHPVIKVALERIGDGHSFFGSPLVESDRATDTATVDPSASRLGDVGYVDVTPFAGGGDDADSLALEYHRLIEGVDTLGPTCGWILDLRGNTGGNMWPMIAGVGPVLGEDSVGFFVDPDSVFQSWFYDGGLAGIDGIPVTVASPPYTLRSPSPHVAVLTDSLTASSGEAVAIAFRGRPDARSFGGVTWGVSTANQAFPLIDGAVIFLTVSTMADRTGVIYGQEILPDEPVAGTKTGDPQTDAALDAALQWLSAGPCS